MLSQYVPREAEQDALCACSSPHAGNKCPFLYLVHSFCIVGLFVGDFIVRSGPQAWFGSMSRAGKEKDNILELGAGR